MTQRSTPENRADLRRRLAEARRIKARHQEAKRQLEESARGDIPHADREARLAALRDEIETLRAKMLRAPDGYKVTILELELVRTCPSEEMQNRLAALDLTESQLPYPQERISAIEAAKREFAARNDEVAYRDYDRRLGRLRVQVGVVGEIHQWLIAERAKLKEAMQNDDSELGEVPAAAIGEN